MAVLLGRGPVTIGRAEEADVRLADEKMSRLHCEIRYWDSDYVVKDLHSRNGTFLNHRRVEVGILRAGDLLRVGGTDFRVDPTPGKGTTTILKEVGQELESGKKGYRTVLREIVKTAEARPRVRPAVKPEAAGSVSEEPGNKSDEKGG